MFFVWTVAGVLKDFAIEDSFEDKGFQEYVVSAEFHTCGISEFEFLPFRAAATDEQAWQIPIPLEGVIARGCASGVRCVHKISLAEGSIPRMRIEEGARPRGSFYLSGAQACGV
jgi:hypothetical protein